MTTNVIPYQPITPTQVVSDMEFIGTFLQNKRNENTRRAYQRIVCAFMAEVKKPLATVTVQDVQGFVQAMADRSPATQNQYLAAVKSMLSFGHRTGYLAFDVGAVVNKLPIRCDLARRILSVQEVQRLIVNAPAGRDRVLLQVIYHTGMRVSEACALTWADAVDRDGGGQLTIFGKGGKTRVGLLQRRTWESLRSIRPEEAKLEGPIFRSVDGGPMNPRSVLRVVHAACEAAGIDKRISTHWLRHAHASQALDAGAKLSLVRDTLGHASLATTNRYVAARPGESSSQFLPEGD